MDDNKFSWPDVRRSIFEMEGPNSDSSTKCFIDHMGLMDFGYSYLSGQYKRAADLVVKALQEGGDSFQPDGLFMPVVYLYRHAIELKLKGLLEIIRDCERVEDNEEIAGLLNKHYIIKLWKKIRPVLIQEWPDADKKPLNNVQALLEDFQRIDKSGQSLRFHKSKNGNDVRRKFPKIVRLELVKEAFDEVYNLLSGCSAHFNDILEHINEMRREYL